MSLIGKLVRAKLRVLVGLLLLLPSWAGASALAAVAPKSDWQWVAQGKFQLSVFSTSTDVMEAKKQGLPVDIIDAPDDESYMSGGFGHVGVVNKSPHPAAARVLLNWLLSKEGQLKWQEKTDNNSLRTDIPKNMLSDPGSIPTEKGRYVNTSLPQYQDIDAALKIVDEALTKAGKR